MKRIITSLALCLLAVAYAAAQATIKVTSFELLASDQTANTPGTIYDDRNGQRCALIKVHVPLKGFSFDTGMMDLKHQEDHPGEKWIWVSPRLKSISILHESFQSYLYEIPIRVESSRTYEMLIDVGTGRYVTIVPQMAGADVEVDGEYVGKAPIINYYMNYGQHVIKARREKSEGEVTRVLTSEDPKHVQLNFDMKDLAYLYGDVVVETDDPRTAIFYNGQQVGTGQWRTQLKEGRHAIVAERADCDPSRTEFDVVRGKENKVTAVAPAPHTGYLSIYTRPRALDATIDGRPVDLTERQILPVGMHQVEFTKKGYVGPVQREYKIVRYETEADTVQLDRIKYIKDKAFYFGAGYTISSMGGVTAILGATLKRNDIQLGYTFGMGKSGDVQWYGNNGSWQSTTQYKQSGFSLKYGYVFELMRLLAITPQVGYNYASLSASVTNGSGNYGDGASAHVASLGVKLLMVPVHHLYVFAAPQYGVAVGKSNNFKTLADKSDVKVDGFSATLGVLFNF